MRQTRYTEEAYFVNLGVVRPNFSEVSMKAYRIKNWKTAYTCTVCENFSTVMSLFPSLLKINSAHAVKKSSNKYTVSILKRKASPI